MVKENTMKQTEIGLLPEDWEVESFLNISNRIGDGIHSTPTYKENEDYFFVNGNNLKNGKVLIDENTKTVSLEQFKIHKRELSNRTILLSINGTIGNIAFFKNEQIILGKSACYINLKNNVNKDYIYFLLQSTSVQKYFEENLTGSTIKNLGLGTISNTKIPLPPLPEQEAIAEALSDADAWIESLEQLIAKKCLIKQGAMQELLTPKEDWEVKKLGEVIDVYRGGSPRPIQDFITDKVDGINWIKIGDTPSSGKYIVSANEKIIPEGEKNSRRVYPGDFLLSNSMSFGRPYILKIDGCIHDGWLVLQNYKSSFDTEFLYYLLTSKYILDQYKSKAAGSGVLNLNKEVVNTVELIIPSLNEQTRIATILSDMDAELEALEGQLFKARKVKQGMMQELLTGRVRLV